MNTKDKLKVMREVEQANKRHEKDWKEAQERTDKEGKYEQADTDNRK